MKKVVILGIVFLFIISAMAGFMSPSPVRAQQKADKVLFLFASPLSGGYAFLGQRELWAAQIAVDQINKMGGIKSLGGAKVEIWKTADITSDPKMGAAALEGALASAKSQGVKISSILGVTVSGMTGPLIPVAEKYGIPMFAAVGMSSLTDLGAKYFFRIFPRNEFWAKAQADFIKEYKETYMPNFKKLGIAYEETAWPTDLANLAKEWIFKKYKVPIDLVAEVPYPKDLIDATPVVTKLRATGAEVVIHNGYAETLYIIRGADAIKYRPFWVGGGGYYVQPEFLTERGREGVKGVVCAMSCNHRWNNPAVDEVNEDFMKKSKLSFIDEHGVAGYAEVWIAKYGIEKAKSTDPGKVKDALHSLEIVMGGLQDEGKMKGDAYISPRALFVNPGGAHLKFNEKGDNIHMAGCLVQWQDVKGKMEPVTVFPEKNTPYKLQR
jgi:branched-chain amino acid transport system substrate-binding protein